VRPIEEDAFERENFLISIFDRLEFDTPVNAKQKGAPERPFFMNLLLGCFLELEAHRQLRLPRISNARRRNPSKLKRAGVASGLTLFLLLKVLNISTAE